MADDEVVKKAKSYRTAKYNSNKTRASANVSRVSNTSTTPAGGNKLKSILADAPVIKAPVEKPKDFWGGVGEALDKPVIKQLIDAISIGTYTAGNATSDAVSLVENATKGKLDPKNILDYANSANPSNIIAKGAMGAVGNEDYQKTQGESIKRIQDLSGIDSESPESRGVQFWGGLAGDIALDPTTYIGAGLATAAVRGATKGSKAFKAEAALARKEGTKLPDSVEPTRWSNAKKSAHVEMDKYRQQKIDSKQIKQVNKQFKKQGNDKKIDFLVENIETLQPAVFRALVKTVDDPQKILDKLDEVPTQKLDAIAQKLDPDTPDIPVGAKAEAPDELIPSVGLSQFKAPTLDEKLFDTLGKLRTTNKTPRYSPDVIKNIELAQKGVEARKAGKATNTPDIPATIDSLIKFDKEMGGTSWPYKVNGKNFTRTTDEMIAALYQGNKNYLDVFNSLDDEFKQFEQVTTKKALDDEAYRKLGIREEDIPLIKQGVKVAEITDEISVGDIESIARDIRANEIPDEALKPFYDIAGTTDRAELAKFIETQTKSDSFKAAAQALEKYGSHRTGVPLPHLGTSGHGIHAIPDKKTSADDILAAKSAANPEQARAFLEAKYEETAIRLAALPEGAALRTLADDVFKATIDVQRAPAGKLRTKRGASTKGPNTTAKWETKYNTHSAMHRITIITQELRKMDSLKKNRSKFDDAYMAVLKDVDDRLRLAGFDPHLSNMRIMGDKLVVRLAPSDVLGAMTKTQRLDFIHGNPMAFAKGGNSREFLPSTIMDMAEVLVRSATRLGPDGQVDFNSLAANALATLQGKFDSLGRGKREIAKNLDINTRIKNDQETLRMLDKSTEGNYAQLHREAKTLADKDAVVNAAKVAHSAEFIDISKKRLEGIPLELFNAFTKGMSTGKPSILSDLVNINMRNASVFGGTVAKQIGEATAEYTAKVINALDTGTPGDFLSELVTRPPFKTADPIATQLVSEGMAKAALVAASPEELKHAKASKAGDNTAAYQKDTDLMTEVNKAPEAMNTEKIFDLSIRERNRDLLWRMYGTSRYFNKRAGMPHSFDTIAQSGHAAALLMTGFHGIIRGWRAKGYTPEQLRVAMNAIKNDLPGDAISNELNSVMRNMFDSSKMNFLERNSIGPEHFNKILEKVGFDEKFRVPPAATHEEMMNAWKAWDIVHVEDFLSKMMTAMVKTAEDVSMGASFSKNFGSIAPGPGLVKITDKSKDNAFFPLINKDLYYPQELANEMVYIGRLMTESRSFKPGTRHHTLITKVLDPVISTLKMTQTTMKPGHHVMSVIGDAWRNDLALAGIGIGAARQVGLYGESARILRSAVGDIDELSEFARFDRIQNKTTQLKLGSTLKGGFETYPNIGKGGKITHNDLYALMQAKGVALPQHLGGMAEDFLTDFSPTVGGTGSRIINGIDRGTQGLDRLMNPLKPKFGMKNPYSLNKFTANRDTWTRGVLFLGAMRSKKFNTVEEAATYAADFVKKWSPTAIDLGGFETKVMRRSIFYYTWLRGMVPRIIEGTLMRPGVALIPNKAMYNLGQANGLDLNSIGDPFPDDTLFPSWYQQKVLGPQWEAGGDLWGFNPTGPLGDVLNSLGSNVKPKDFVTPDAYTQTAGTFLNMSTPWFKAPMELVQGKTLQGGAPIEDPFQYLQDMIGPARTVSRVTGKDLYPAIGPDGVGLPNRTEKKFRNGMTPEETTENALPELLNWASGMQFTNYTSDSASNSAYYQAKQKSQEKSKMDERFR